MQNLNPFEDSLFIPAPFFMVRTAVWSMDDYFELLKHPEPSDYLFNLFESNEFLREAIAIASPSLYQSLLNKNSKAKKEKDQLASSLLRYILRMTSRATPFGLFSFVSMGFWNQTNGALCVRTQRADEIKPIAHFDSSKIMKRARPDMEWMRALLDKVSSDPTMHPFLQFKTNPLMSQSGDRISLNYTRRKNTSISKVISIRSNFLTQAIFGIAKGPISINDLEDKVIDQYSQLDRGKTREVIAKLMEQQLLTLALSPSLLTESPLKDLLSTISSSPDLAIAFRPLFETSKNLDLYNQAFPGSGEKQLAVAQAAMEKASSAISYVQVDAVYQNSQFRLPASVSIELSQAVEVLWKLSSESQILSSYHSLFLEKYGMHRIVPLLIFLAARLDWGRLNPI